MPSNDEESMSSMELLRSAASMEAQGGPEMRMRREESRVERGIQQLTREIEELNAAVGGGYGSRTDSMVEVREDPNVPEGQIYFIDDAEEAVDETVTFTGYDDALDPMINRTLSVNAFNRALDNVREQVARNEMEHQQAVVHPAQERAYRRYVGEARTPARPEEALARRMGEGYLRWKKRLGGRLELTHEPGQLPEGRFNCPACMRYHDVPYHFYAEVMSYEVECEVHRVILQGLRAEIIDADRPDSFGGPVKREARFKR